MKVLAVIVLLLLGFKPVADDVSTRFKIPVGYSIPTVTGTGFGQWLAHLPLKPAGTHTLTYKGDKARTDAYTAAVIDMGIGNQDLQQCADAVMRLRAEHLYHQKRYNDIAFNFTSGFRCDYAHYANGYRYVGEKWVKKATKDTSYAAFMRYMNLVFS